MTDSKYIDSTISYLHDLYNKLLEVAKNEYETMNLENLYLPSVLNINDKLLCNYITMQIESQEHDVDVDSKEYDNRIDLIKHHAMNKFRKIIGPHTFLYDNSTFKIQFIHNL